VAAKVVKYLLNSNVIFLCVGLAVLREGMGQATGYESRDALETVITNAVCNFYTTTTTATTLFFNI
jgi:hypothetical protein